jgi:hypothetical protein
MMGRLSVAILALLCLPGCATTARYVDGQVSKREVEYGIGVPQGSWFRQKDRASDLRYQHASTGSTVYVLSTCRGFQDAPLLVLANHLFFGFDEETVRSQKIFQLDRREALERIVLSRLDGVDMGAAVTVLKKNACVFDFVLLATPDHFDALLPAYRDWVQSFQMRDDAGR